MVRETIRTVTSIDEILKFSECNPRLHRFLENYIHETRGRENRLRRKLAFYEESSEDLEDEEREDERATQSVSVELRFNEEKVSQASFSASDRNRRRGRNGAKNAATSSDNREPHSTTSTRSESAPEVFHVKSVDSLPRQLKRKLQEPTSYALVVSAYEVVVDGGRTSIDCGFCKHRFQTLKEWRIHAAKIHRRDGYCAACTYYLTLPHAFTTEQKQAAVEVHMLYCCPRAHESILDDRRVKRNRLELTETGEMAQHLHSPGEIFFY